MDKATRAVEVSLQKALIAIEAHVDELGALDAAAGDGDHGTTMVRGLRAANYAVEELPDDASAGELLLTAGSAFADAAGGASGALFGMFILSIGQQLGNGPYYATTVAGALQTAASTARRMGKAEVGDKTFVDTLDPFVDALGQAVEAGNDITTSWKFALPAAKVGMNSTAGMVAKKGRASRLGERSRDGLDPGAVSMYYLLKATSEALEQVCPSMEDSE